MLHLKKCPRPRDCEGWHCTCGRHLITVNVCPDLLQALASQGRDCGTIEFCEVCEAPIDQPGRCSDCEVQA